MSIFHEILICFLPSHDAFFFMWVLGLLGIFAVFITLERFFSINARTDYDAPSLFSRVAALVNDKKLDEAYDICASGGNRALPRILGAGIKKAKDLPGMVSSAMEEESVHMAAALEKRLNLMVMFGNVATLLGLLGTVFGLIMSFAAVGQPGVAAVEKSALLANGISTAMNSTLVGLSISIPCVLVYAFFRARVDVALSELDRYSVAILNLLTPPEMHKPRSHTLVRRSGGEDDAADTDVTPLLNLMVMLIPFLLSSSEFVKIGAIELKLPEASSQAGGGGGGPSEQQKQAKLDIGVAITAKGFNLFHAYKTEISSAGPSTPITEKLPDIPLVNGKYDYKALNKQLADVKRKVLFDILKAYNATLAENVPLYQLYKAYSKQFPNGTEVYADNDAIKIVAEERVKYETVIAVMDAARGVKTTEGDVTMFPNVSIAGGIVQ